MLFGDDVTTLVEATVAFFSGAAWTLTETGFADACPVATPALEVASTNEGLRRATSAVFDDWVNRASARLVVVQHGISPVDAHRLACESVAEGSVRRGGNQTSAMTSHHTN